MRVVDRRRTVRPFGACRRGALGMDTCDGVMLLPRDASYVLRAAIAFDRHGGNIASEYDL